MNLEAEKAILGAIMINATTFERVAAFLRPEHFALGQNGDVYLACATLIRNGRLADPVTLKEVFEKDDRLADIGGVEYLAELATSGVAPSTAEEYGRIIYDLARRRRLIEVGEILIRSANAGDIATSPDTLIDETAQQLFDVGADSNVGPRPLGEILNSGLAAAEKAYKEGETAGVKTGLTDLDYLLGGLFPGDLLVLAGATSMGKTTLAMTIARNAARRAVPGLGFSLEMPGEHLGMREIAGQCGLPMNAVRAGRFEAAEFSMMVEAVERMRDLPIYIDDRPALPLAAITGVSRRYVRDKKIGFILVDYLQLVRPDNRYLGQRVQEVSEIARGLKNLGRALNVPVVALSQLSRALEQRESKRPVLADLRESGEIEQAADVIAFVYRHGYYLQRNPPVQRERESAEDFADRLADHEAALARWENRAEVIVAKNRNGPTGNVELHFDPTKWQFGNADTQEANL